MHYLYDFLENKVLIAALLAWLFAQVLKTILYSLLNKRLELERLWGAGGMPSAHSAMVVALALSTARFYGYDHPIFALALVLAFVVIYDAMGVRRETGRHAKLLNQYLNELLQKKLEDDKPVIDLKELVGHTPIEVLGGVIVGIVVGISLPIVPMG